MADLVKLSGDDLEWLMPDLSHEEAAAAILKKGPRAVFQTGGSAGARAHWAGDILSAKAVRVEVADTIGAGDTFNAGVLAALDQAGVLSRDGLTRLTPENLLAALTLGTRAAAITVSRPGANPPWAHELAALPA
jgi:fructokinase